MPIIDCERHVWHLFVIRNKQRDNLQKYLSKKGVQTLIHYPTPPHKQRAYTNLNEMKFQLTEKIHCEVLSLPLSPIMEKKEIDTIIRTINKF